MISRLLLRLGRVGFILLAAAGLATSGQAGDLALRVMSFNVRYASEQPPHAWSARRPALAQTVRAAAPDVIGTQEGVYSQLRDIAADLPAYDWIGLGREGGSRGEFCAVFYLRDRFEPVAFDHFWLSDTPEVVASATWGNRFRRMATWVRLRDRASGRELVVLNTHFDHEVEPARQQSAALIRERLARFEPDLPMVVLGDFNCAAGASVAFDLLTADTGLIDTWTQAARRTPRIAPATYHGYAPADGPGERIDWILARQPVDVSAAEIVTTTAGDRHSSDHFPVVADLRFPAPQPEVGPPRSP